MAYNPDTAPAPKKVSSHMAAGLAKLKEDKKKLEEMAVHSAESTWFDGDAPGTRQRRETTRANFEACITEIFEKQTIREIWAMDTFIDYSKQFLEAMIILSRGGKIKDKIRTDTLWKHKDALYWWGIRFIDNFGEIYPGWHGQLVAHIHYLGRTYGLEQGHHPKNNLTDAELMLFYRQLVKLHQGVDNWKQHFVAWLLVYITGVRPGSFTVCPGYEKGASLGKEGLVCYFALVDDPSLSSFLLNQIQVRPDDETLRWSDVTFFHFPDVEGISVRVDFKYIKNQRNPFTHRAIEGKKTFTFLPTRGERYELDLSALLLALAFSRGLFPHRTIEEVLKDDHQYIPKVAAVDKQAVFVNANQANEIDVSAPMREPALNPKLKQMCVNVGLLEHNTIYSFRRTAIIEVRRLQGTEFARELAGHKPDSASIIAYDVDATLDVDITALRTGQEGVSRSDIRAAFKQITVVPTNTSAQAVDYAQELRDRTTNAVTADPQYVEMEQKVFTMLSELASILDLNQPRLGSKIIFEEYRARLEERDMFTELDALNELLAKRKTLRKSLTTRYSNEQKEEMLQGQNKAMKATQKQAKGLHGTLGQPKPLRDIAAKATSEHIDNSGDAALAAVSTAVAAAAADGGNDDDDADVDAGAVDEALEGTREEPAHWSKLKDNVVMMAEGNGDGKATEQGRLQFLKSYVALSSVQASNRALDPTADSDRVWTKAHLDTHLKSAYHTRRAEILRAAANSVDSAGKITCPLCDEISSRANFIKHVEMAHIEHI